MKSRWTGDKRCGDSPGKKTHKKANPKVTTSELPVLPVCHREPVGAAFSYFLSTKVREEQSNGREAGEKQKHEDRQRQRERDREGVSNISSAYNSRHSKVIFESIIIKKIHVDIKIYIL